MALGEVKRSCSTCKVNPEARKAWGCEQDTEFPQFELPFCLRCNGTNAECEMCHGSARVPIFRCPLALVGSEHYEMVSLFSHYQRGFLPDAGGILDQAPAFLDGVRLLLRCQAMEKR